MTTKFKNLFIAFVLTLLIMPLVPIKASAVNSTLTANTSSVSPITQESTIVNGKYNPAGEFPTVTIDKATEFVERKGFEVIGFLQRVIQPFSVIIFIIGAIISMLGFLHKDAFRAGLIIIVVSVIMHTGVLFAPEILSFFSQWLSS